MVSISILGTGNVAEHLCEAFISQKEIKVNQVIGRNPDSLANFKNKVDTVLGFKSISDSDVYIIAVSDDAISTVSQLLQNKKGLIVHTSGNVPLHVLPTNLRTGVFYPLQTFTKGQPLNFKRVPVCLEAKREPDLELLHSLASLISSRVYFVDSEQRKRLHLSAVFVNNFSNHMFHIAHEICKDNNLSFDILKPLILETTKKIETLSPYESQTGPARRKDTGTMQTHIDLLTQENYKEIYRLLSRSIQKTYGKEL
ncbi:Rossmann-like and DUF2520 domain-containing protein [Ulvibacterium sp.]|uniref:Rossmann-like and DUF2520 domain-containing protein n=1 Tax=Ulvibacterium sp. TaxID=2665914 RepID=UPI00261412A5|nr:Rossmann-like and DUF2520 domain-containing protein [Ulvibacterium sp.]